MTATLDIPIFPLGTVLYPDGLLPLRIFEQRYVDMTKACIGNEAVFGVSLILDGREAGTPAVPHAVGCTARIVEWDVPSPGLFTLLTRGETVFRIHERRVQADGLIRAVVELLPAPPPSAVAATHPELSQLFDRIVERIGAEAFPQPLCPHDGGWVCHRIAEVLDLPLAARQRVLEIQDSRAKQALLWDLIRAQAQPDTAD